MDIHIAIQSAPLHWPESTDLSSGAVVRFTGVVRAEEGGRTIAGLNYEAYQPMAENTMRQILEKLCASYPFRKAVVLHRIGFVPVGEAALVMEIQSAHRSEALRVTTAFLDLLKQDVPIWKVGSR